jgi:quinoprotein relay system zinc metallohydrolase 2
VHFDHVLGNAAFQADGPKFIGHAKLAAAVRRSQEFFVAHYSADLDPDRAASEIIGPDQGVAQELTLDLGRRPLTLRAWPLAHSDCDLTIEDTRSGTLWTGDLLFRERLPVVDGSAKGWEAVIDSLVRLKVKRAIPGHGPMTTDLPAALLPQRQYLQSLLEDIRTALGQGLSMQAAAARIGTTQRSHWLLWDETQPRNVARVWQEVEWE